MSVHRRTSLQLNNNFGDEEKQNRDHALGSETSIKRKGGLKPQSQRHYSHHKIEDQQNIGKRVGQSIKGIRSNRSIQFKKSADFQTFEYFKETNRSNQLGPQLRRQQEKTQECCRIM